MRTSRIISELLRYGYALTHRKCRACGSPKPKGYRACELCPSCNRVLLVSVYQALREFARAQDNHNLAVQVERLGKTLGQYVSGITPPRE